MLVRSLVLAASISGALSPAAFAQAPAQAPAKPAKPAATLGVGNPAPTFAVETFLNGTPITGLEKGKIYVVEFWATWCGPCVQSMPHISELQHEYADKGVTIIGVNVWEDPEYSDETITKARKFVEKQRDRMAYTVAFDGSAKHMDTKWMQAAGRGGIPSAFVVDKSGTVAWIGHPQELDMVLDGVTSGTWDYVAGPKKIEAAGKAFTDAGESYKNGIADGNKAWDAAMTSYPAFGKQLAGDRFNAMLDAKLYSDAYTVGNKIIDDAVAAKKPGGIFDVYLRLTDAANRPEVFDKDLLMKATMADYAMNDPNEARAHYRLARAYFACGETDKARAEAAKCMELEVPEMKERREKMLKDVEESFQK